MSNLCLQDRSRVVDFWPGWWHRREWRSWCCRSEDDSSCWLAAGRLYTCRRTAAPAGWQSSPGSDESRKWSCPVKSCGSQFPYDIKGNLFFTILVAKTGCLEADSQNARAKIKSLFTASKVIMIMRHQQDLQMCSFLFIKSIMCLASVFYIASGIIYPSFIWYSYLWRQCCFVLICYLCARLLHGSGLVVSTILWPPLDSVEFYCRIYTNNKSLQRCSVTAGLQQWMDLHKIRLISISFLRQRGSWICSSIKRATLIL